MGLYVSHDCWRGPYSAFHRWRCTLARILGINLETMEGFEEQGNPRKGYGTKWEVLRPDPIHKLLRHSDCDGDISPVDAALIAARLDEIIKGYEGKPDPGTMRGGSARADYDGFLPACKRFRDGLARAAAANEVVKFG